MTKEIMANELEQVTGGTVSELEDLMSANTSGNILAEGGAHVPGFNNGAAVTMTNRLSSLGIDADISLGFAGTGFGSVANKYTNKETGAIMSHQEVLDVLKANS